MNDTDTRLMNERACASALQYGLDFGEDATVKACVEAEILRYQLAKARLEIEELKERLP